MKTWHCPLSSALQGVRPGTHSMMVAIKKLVEAAVLDQRNERFVLVGNTTGAACLGALLCVHVWPLCGCSSAGLFWWVLPIFGRLAHAWPKVPKCLTWLLLLVVVWLPALLCPCAARCASQPLLPPRAAVPLYHPAMFYQQLMSESKSRVDACPHEVGAAPLRAVAAAQPVLNHTLAWACLHSSPAAVVECTASRPTYLLPSPPAGPVARSPAQHARHDHRPLQP